MKKGKIPKIKQLQDQTGRILWFGDESCHNAEFSFAQSKEGDELFYFYPETNKLEKKGFLARVNGVLSYYKESDRRFVIPPRWWHSQVRAKPGEKAVCVGGGKRKGLIMERKE